MYIVFASAFMFAAIWSHHPATTAAIRRSSLAGIAWTKDRFAALDDFIRPSWNSDISKSSARAHRAALLWQSHQPAKHKSEALPLRKEINRKPLILASSAHSQHQPKQVAEAPSPLLRPSLVPEAKPAGTGADREIPPFRPRDLHAKIRPSISDIGALTKNLPLTVPNIPAPDAQEASLTPPPNSSLPNPAASFHTPASSPMDSATISVPPPPGFVSFCLRFPTQCPTKTGDVSKIFVTPASWSTLEHVNETVNDAISPEDDSDHYGRAEYWTIPTDGLGNCHDYAVTKRKMLIDAGLPVLALRLAIVIRPRGDRHAVLTIATDRGDYVLDNLSSEIRPWTETSYTWIERQSAKSAWDWVALDSSLISQNLRRAPRLRPTRGSAGHREAHRA